MPVATNAIPTGVTENKLQVSICCSTGNAWLEVKIKSFNKINGLEPTIVTVPPKIAQKPIGISKRDIGKPERAEIRETTGKNKAAAPTFCMNDEIKPTVAEMIGMMRASVVPPTFRIKAATLVMMPVLAKPAPMIMTAMIDITAFDEKPLNNFWLSTKPPLSPIKGATKDVRPKITMTVAAATSTSTTSNANK